MSKDVDRERNLADKFNKASCEIFKSEKKYKDLKISDFIELKNVLSNIHNIITMKVTQAFIDKLKEDEFIFPDQATRMKEVVNGTSANANGYDVRHDESTKLDNVKKFKYRDRKILAEVKCNLPYNKSTFGSGQIDGIIDDIKGLLKGKTKEEIKTDDYYKFMVFLSYENGEGKSVEESVKNLINSLSDDKKKYKGEYNGEYKGKLEYYEDDSANSMTKEKVYIIFISLDKKY